MTSKEGYNETAVHNDTNEIIFYKGLTKPETSEDYKTANIDGRTNRKEDLNTSLLEEAKNIIERIDETSKSNEEEEEAKEEEEEEEEEGEEEYDYMHAEDNYEDVTLPERDGSRSSGTGR